jgi:hypothetical protein
LRCSGCTGCPRSHCQKGCRTSRCQSQCRGGRLPQKHACQAQVRAAVRHMSTRAAPRSPLQRPATARALNLDRLSIGICGPCSHAPHPQTHGVPPPPATPQLPAAFPTLQLQRGAAAAVPGCGAAGRLAAAPQPGTVAPKGCQCQIAACAPWRCDGARAASARGHAGRAVWCSLRRRPRLTEHRRAGWLEEEHVCRGVLPPRFA